MNPLEARRAQAGFTLIELTVVLAIIGILACIAIPNFLRCRARARQSEVKGNLKAIFVAEKAYAAEHAGFSAYFSDIGYRPERGNRYAYQLGTSSVEMRTAAGAVDPADGRVDAIGVDGAVFSGPVLPPFQGTVVGALGLQADGNFTATATGELDTDPGVDSWQVSSADVPHAPACGGEAGVLAAGSPYDEYDDVSCP